ncbi:MAG: dipeptide epimerase [Sulfurovaceae bacterium]|nr:dipeptide epimerase [Sulfurovaceae bacterium]
MKIISIRTALFRSPLKTPFKTALRTVENLEDIVVIIECNDGSIGYGEGSPTAVITGETLGTMEAAISYLSQFIIGLDVVTDFEEILHKLHTGLLHNTTAKSAIEIALYDLRSKAQKKPFYEFLGGTQKKFETDITISLNDIDTMIKDCLKAVSIGYKILKIKLGNNPSKDIDRIIAINDALPKDIILRLDANQGWNKEDSVLVMQTIESKGIMAQCIEQPVKADDITGLKYIKERILTPVLADEAVFNLAQANFILESNSADYLNIKLSKCGGITEAIKIANRAREFGVSCMMGCMLEGPIGITAALHVVSAISDVITMVDLDAVALLSTPPHNCSVIFDENKILLSDEIGLGIKYEN